MGGTGTPTHCRWECKMLQSWWKPVWQHLQKLSLELPRDPAVPLLGVCLWGGKTYVHIKPCTQLSVEASFIIIKKWNNRYNQKMETTQVPSADERMHNMWPIHAVDSQWILLNRRKEWNPDMHYNADEPWIHDARWTEPDTKTRMSYDSIYTTDPEQANPENVLMVSRARGKEVMGSNGYGASSGGEECSKMRYWRWWRSHNLWISRNRRIVHFKG